MHLLLLAIVVVTTWNVASADFRDDAVTLHNQYRAKHHSPPLTIDKDANAYAQNWAQKMADMGKLQHSDTKGKYGENIYYFQSSGCKISDSAAVKKATTAWYNEVEKYDYNKPGFTMETGHFTQVVWKNSKGLGIGVARSGNKVFVCGNYSPPGNYKGQFPDNVQKP